MKYLLTDTADQTLRLSLAEGRAYFESSFTHYLLIIVREENNIDDGLTLSQVPEIVSETERITTLTITTEGLNKAGLHRYEVYGQNSDDNTDVEDESVVGLVERGLIELTSNDLNFVKNSSTFDNDERESE